jgi:hypothetical protein
MATTLLICAFKIFSLLNFVNSVYFCIYVSSRKSRTWPLYAIRQQSPQLKTSECHSNGTDQSESAAFQLSTLSHIPFTWHSGTEVVTSGAFASQTSINGKISFTSLLPIRNGPLAFGCYKL